MFAHQLKLRVRISFPNRHLGERHGDRPIPERIVPALLHVVNIAPGHVHGGFIRRTKTFARLAPLSEPPLGQNAEASVSPVCQLAAPAFPASMDVATSNIGRSLKP
jgi:hypothetical protein